MKAASLGTCLRRDVGLRTVRYSSSVWGISSWFLYRILKRLIPQSDDWTEQIKYISTIMVRTKWPDDDEILHTCVEPAPVIAGSMMYEVELECAGEHTKMFKNKSEFRDLLAVFELGGPSSCRICSSCNLGTEKPKIAAAGYMAKDLDRFIEAAIQSLRHMRSEDLSHCSHHIGVVRMLMEFLNIRDERCFATPKTGLEELKATDCSSFIMPCTLSRSLSNQFTRFDSSG